MSKRAMWNTAICIAGIGYIVMELWLNIQSPLFAAAFVLVAGYELIESHSARRKSRPFRDRPNQTPSEAHLVNPAFRRFYSEEGMARPGRTAHSGG